MVRTQVSLDEREHMLAKKQAKALGISLAEFVRKAIRDALSQQRSTPWMRYAGLVESGNPESSRSIDAIVYGSKD